MTRLLWLVIFAAGTACARPPAFDVASVKAAAKPEKQGVFCVVPCTVGERFDVQGARVDIRYFSIRKLIEAAHGLKSYQLIGPDWMDSQRFDIVAKLPQGAKTDIPTMLKTLLAERFHLAVRNEDKELPVLALIVSKSGAKLDPPPDDAEAPIRETPGSMALYTPQGDARMLDNGASFVVTSGPYGPMRAAMVPGGGLRTELLKVTMAGLADVLAPHVERPVIDRTGLTGAYHLTWVTRPAGGGPGTDPMGDALLSAIEKAGLKLEKTAAPIHLVVVEHVDKTPVAN
jgi:uncharacterized protein (TIGR03435 family)